MKTIKQILAEWEGAKPGLFSGRSLESELEAHEREAVADACRPLVEALEKIRCDDTALDALAAHRRRQA